MRSLSVQVQPDRSPDLDVAGLSEAFRSLLCRTDLVLRHSFDNGDDDGVYYNFTFGTERPAELWQALQESIFTSSEFKDHLANASMVMCSSDQGWDDYVQLYHWNPAVPVVSASAL